MVKRKDNLTKPRLKNVILSVVAITILCALSVLFLIKLLSLEAFPIKGYNTQILSLGIGIIAIIICALIIAFLLTKTTLFRLVFTILILITLSLSVLYFLIKSGIFTKVTSVKELREYIKGFGASALLATLVLQILQVVILPIPGVITIGVSVALFGALKGAIISFVGIFIGSVIAFLIGRKLGKRTVCWLVGEDNLNRVQKKVNGKDKIVLSFMFLFPFFPDDLLCFVAGLSTMPIKYFLIMITITRLISVFTTAYSVNGSVIPYDTWWGLLIWVVLIALTLLSSYYLYKNSDKIKLFNRTKKSN